MFYTDAIYLILALVLFSGWPVEESPSLKGLLGPFLLKELVFVGVVFLKLRLSREPRDFLRAQAVLKFLAFLAFAVDVIGLSWPGLFEGKPAFLRDLFGLLLFLHYFLIIWLFSALYESRGPLASLSPPSYVWSNLKLLFPFLLPWAAVNLVFSLLDRFLPWGGFKKELLYLAVFLVTLLFFMAPLAVRIWDCRPLPESNLRRIILAYLRREGGRLREIYLWETFGGRLLTAGVIGVLPGLRYLLISKGLLAALEEMEILSVVAHETGHLKHRHMLWLLIFFVLFSLLVYLAFYPAFLLFLAYFPFPELLGGLGKKLFLPEAIFTLGLILAVLVYFRLLLGFFLRNFERQADLYCLESLGTAEGLIRSLKKIALLSGHTEDLPSWHHFSIKERIEFLRRAQENPALIPKHHFKVKCWLSLYVSVSLALSLIFWQLPVEKIEKRAKLNLLYGGLMNEYRSLPSAKLEEMLGTVAYELGREGEALKWYERALKKEKTPELMNNLAWLLLTAKNKELRDYRRGLELALRATAQKPTAFHLDTLAEAFFRNGDRKKACLYATWALEEARKSPKADLDYYRRQKERFCHAAEPSPALP